MNVALFNEPTPKAPASTPDASPFWSLCRLIDASELDAELLAWAEVHDLPAPIEAIRTGAGKGREWIDRCLGFIARRRCEVEPCWPWMVDQRHGAEWRRLRDLAGIPDAVEPPEEPLPDPEYATLPLDRLDRYVLEAVADGRVFVETAEKVVQP